MSAIRVKNSRYKNNMAQLFNSIVPRRVAYMRFLNHCEELGQIKAFNYLYIRGTVIVGQPCAVKTDFLIAKFAMYR